jgi:hypothetical protein
MRAAEEGEVMRGVGGCLVVACWSCRCFLLFVWDPNFGPTNEIMLVAFW